MSSTFTKVAAVAAASALVISGAQAAHAQSAGSSVGGNVKAGDGQGAATGQLDLGSLGSTGKVAAGTETKPAADPVLPSGSLKAYGQSPDLGSLRAPVNNGVNGAPNGSLDTSGSAIGEPTSGSLAGLLTGAEGSANFSNPTPGTGSIDTTKGSLGEPTSGSLAPLVTQVAAALGTGAGITTILNSASASGTGSTGSLASLPGLNSVATIAPTSSGMGSLLPLVAVGGSIALGVAAAPAIQQAVSGMGVIPAGSVLPPLPGMTPPAPKAPTAPGPTAPNGRG